jgi:hypothetical protein
VSYASRPATYPCDAAKVPEQTTTSAHDSRTGRRAPFLVAVLVAVRPGGGEPKGSAQAA